MARGKKINPYEKIKERSKEVESRMIYEEREQAFKELERFQKEQHDFIDFRFIRGIYEGEKFLIHGKGPTAKDITPEELNSYIVIGINGTPVIYKELKKEYGDRLIKEKPDILILKDNHNGVRKDGMFINGCGVEIVFTRYAISKDFLGARYVFRFDTLAFRKIYSKAKDCALTVVDATYLAILLGARVIHYLGALDFTVGSDGKVYTKEFRDNRNILSRGKEANNWLGSIKDVFVKRGIEVLNLSRNTKIDAILHC